MSSAGVLYFFGVLSAFISSDSSFFWCSQEIAFRGLNQNAAPTGNGGLFPLGCWKGWVLKGMHKSLDPFLPAWNLCSGCWHLFGCCQPIPKWNWWYAHNKSACKSGYFNQFSIRFFSFHWLIVGSNKIK